MSTEPVPKPPAETRSRQRNYLVGAVVVVASVLLALVLFDRSGASRPENEGRSNETQMNKPEPVNPAANAR